MPIQQWVLSLPPALRILCAFRPEVLTRTLHAFVRAVFAFQRRRAALTDTANAQPELAGLIAESVSFPKGRVVDPLLARSPSIGLCGVDGFNLHAGVGIGARDSGSGRRCPMSGSRGSTTAGATAPSRSGSRPSSSSRGWPP